MTTNATTDPETGLRFYRWLDHEYPSVTSIRRLVGMPYNLHNWAIGKVLDRAIDEYATLGQMLTREARPRERVLAKNRITEARKWLRAASTEERDAAGDRGNKAHLAIADGVAPSALDPEVRPFVEQFYDFMHTTGAKILWSERQIFNLKLGYAGTGDALMEIDWGGHRTLCVDYKTSKGIYLDHAIQLIAYVMGEFVGENDVVDSVATEQLHAVDGIAILHLSDSGWELVEIEPKVELFEAFSASLNFARFLHANDNSVEGLILRKQEGGTLIPALTASIEAEAKRPSRSHDAHMAREHAANQDGPIGAQSDE